MIPEYNWLILLVSLGFFSVDNMKIGPDNSVMTITNAQTKNQGTYRCVASNLFGMTHSIVSLIVRGIAKFDANFEKKKW